MVAISYNRLENSLESTATPVGVRTRKERAGKRVVEFTGNVDPTISEMLVLLHFNSKWLLLK